MKVYFCKIFSLLGATLFCIFLNFSCVEGQQDTFRIAAVANDKIITMADVENRLKLVLATSNLVNTPDLLSSLREQVLKSLIDESLQIQEAEKRGISITPEELEKAITYIEAQNGKPEGSLKEMMKEKGIPLYTLEDQIKANISWLRLISEQYGPTVIIADKETDQVLKKIQDSLGTPQVKVSEIFLSIDSPEKEKEVIRIAKGFSTDVKKGASFDMFARQFSEAPSASSGGDIGWVNKGQLEETLDKALFSLKEGEVSEPIRTKTGVYLFFVKEKAQSDGSKEAIYTFKNFLLPLFLDKSPEAYEQAASQIETIKKDATSCESLDLLAEEISGRVEILEDVSFASIPGEIQNIIKDLPIETPSQVIKTPEGVGFMMICKKEEKGTKIDLPDKTTIRQKLTSQKLELIARRVLRDLRRAAFIETRI